MNALFKNGFVRAVVGLVVLFVLLTTAGRYIGEYRRSVRGSSSTPQGSVEPSATVEESPSAEGEDAQEGSPGPSAEKASEPEDESPDTLTVKIDGLNLRSGADRGAKSIRGLEKGDKLILLSESDGWYEVRTEDGTRGWVSTNPSYTTIEEQ